MATGAKVSSAGLGSYRADSRVCAVKGSQVRLTRLRGHGRAEISLGKARDENLTALRCRDQTKAVWNGWEGGGGGGQWRWIAWSPHAHIPSHLSTTPDR